MFFKKEPDRQVAELLQFAEKMRNRELAISPRIEKFTDRMMDWLKQPTSTSNVLQGFAKAITVVLLMIAALVLIVVALAAVIFVYYMMYFWLVYIVPLAVALMIIFYLIYEALGGDDDDNGNSTAKKKNFGLQFG